MGAVTNDVEIIKSLLREYAGHKPSVGDPVGRHPCGRASRASA